MNRTALAALISAATAFTCPAFAGTIQMLPPTPLGSTVICPSGSQQLLSYSGTPQGGPQAGINCVPITTDAQGDMAAAGYVQLGTTLVSCDAAHAGAMRFNPVTSTFEGCNGSGAWQALGGGPVGKLYWDGNWGGNTYWCDSGYHLVAFHYDCGCTNNSDWFECQAN